MGRLISNVITHVLINMQVVLMLLDLTMHVAVLGRVCGDITGHMVQEPRRCRGHWLCLHIGTDMRVSYSIEGRKELRG